MDVVIHKEENPSLEVDEHTMRGHESCMLEEYVSAVSFLRALCTDLESDTRDEAFISNLGDDENDEEAAVQRIDDPSSPLMIISFKEVFQSLEGVQDFLDIRE